MSGNQTVETMFKFGERRHIEEFARGCLYMNPVEYFIELEKEDPLRGDSREGTGHVRRPDGTVLRVKVGEHFKRVGEMGWSSFRPYKNLKVNIFCMYALLAGEPEISVDARNYEFGPAFAMLRDFVEFMKRVKAAFPNVAQESARADMVEYLDEHSYEGEIGIFRKRSAFSFQNEFRIAFMPGTGEALRFQIGDISDIVLIGNVSEMNHGLRVHVNERGERSLVFGATEVASDPVESSASPSHSA